MKQFFLSLFVFLGLGFLSQAQTVIFTEDFEATSYPTIPAIWSQNQIDTAARWKCGTNAVMASSSFVVPAHTKFICVNDDKDSSTHNLHDTLRSAVFSTVGYTNVYLSFDMFYLNGNYGGDTEKFSVIISTDGGSSWNLLSTMAGITSPAWATQFISLASYAGNANVKIAFVYSDAGGWEYGAAVDNVKIYSPATADLALTAITPVLGDPTAYGLGGATVALSGTVQNMGINTVTSYKVTYQLGAAAPVASAPISASIAPFTSGTFSGINMTLPAAIGITPVKVWVTLVGDTNPLNDSAFTQLGTASFMPTKKLLVEEQTGTWCGWCVRGIVYMDSLRELYHSNVSLIAVHNSDPMTVSAYDSWATSFPGFTGFPSVIIDRRELSDPQNLLSIYSAEHSYFGFANISTSNPHISGTTYTDTVTITPAMDYSGDYRVILAVTEDQVHNASGNTWDQHNYYSSTSANQPLTGQGFDYQAAPNPIPSAQMYFNHVARAISPSPTGSANLPASMTHGTNYPVVVSATLDPNWVVNNLVGVVMLVRGSDGVVLNTQNLGTPWVYTAVQNVNQGINKLLIYPNPANDVAYVNFELSQETNVGVQVTDAIGRIVYTMPASQMGSGNHNITIPTHNFAAGLYNVSIMTEQGHLTQRLSVVR